jgi:hypothetical protein
MAFEYESGMSLASQRLSCRPDLALRGALTGLAIVEEVGVGRERHWRRVARLPCDLDDVRSFGDEERYGRVA